MRTWIATAIAFLAIASPALADTDVTGGPSGTTTDATPTFTFRGEPGSTYECKVDPVSDWKPCASPYSVQLADGDYKYKFRVKSLSYFALGEMLDVFDPYALNLYL